MDFDVDPRDRDDQRPELDRGSRGAVDRDRDRDSDDPRDVFMRGLDLPRSVEREIVRDRDCERSLRGSETRSLSIVGSFRVVNARDLRGHHETIRSIRTES